MEDTNTSLTESNTPQKLFFNADIGEFYLLIIKNFFLTIFSLGIYWFWAKVEITKFLYKSTRIQGFEFDYHATGKEKFFGFLKALGILILVVIANGAIGWVLQQGLGEQIGSIFGVLFFYILLFAALPFIIIGSLRFRLSRTSLNGIRFQFLGDLKEFTLLFLKSFGFTLITFGIYFPWAMASVGTYIAQNSLFGNHAFDLRVDGKELFFIFLKGIFFTLITLGFYSFWYRANVHNYFWNNYYFQNGKTSSNLTGNQLLIVFLKSVGILIITFGMGFPWIFLISQKVIVESVSFTTSIDFESISSIEVKPGSATIESLGGDTLDSFGSMVG